jgi:hypothetical protein
MLMRYHIGLGVGHRYSHHRAESRLDEPEVTGFHTQHGSALTGSHYQVEEELDFDKLEVVPLDSVGTHEGEPDDSGSDSSIEANLDDESDDDRQCEMDDEEFLEMYG